MKLNGDRCARRLVLSLARVIDKASRFHPRDRYSNAAEMLDALQSAEPAPTAAINHNQSAPVAPDSSTMPTMQVAPLPTLDPTNISQPNIARPNVARSNRRDPDQHSTTDAFILIGLVLACVAGIVGIGYYVVDAIANRAKPDPKPTVTASPSPNPDDLLAQDPDGVSEPDQFYFLADSAYEDPENAKRRYEQLRSQGYENAGTFWLPDYPNLDAPYIQVYADRFAVLGKARCTNLLRDYGKEVPDAYCALASKDADAAIDRVLARDVVPKPKPKPEKTPKPDSDPQDAVRDYYDLINEEQYPTAWEQLSEAFKANDVGGGYEDSFLEWWNLVDRVVVTGTRTTKQSPDKATVEAQLIYYMKDGSNSPESLRIQLVWDAENKRWLFDRTERF
jgi:serine/threonine-protein kinase